MFEHYLLLIYVWNNLYMVYLFKFKKNCYLFFKFLCFLFCCFIRFPVYFLKKWASLVKKKNRYTPMAATKTRFNPQSAIGHSCVPGTNFSISGSRTLRSVVRETLQNATETFVDAAPESKENGARRIRWQLPQ